MVTESRLIAAYGNPREKDAFAAKNLTTWALPDWLKGHWPRYLGQVVLHFTINKFIIPALKNVMRDLIALDLIHELHTFDGCYALRDQRGAPGVLSMHAFGLAIDFNAATNRLGGSVHFSPAFLAVWRAHGWTCGADFHGSRVDGMHFEYTKTL